MRFLKLSRDFVDGVLIGRHPFPSIFTSDAVEVAIQSRQKGNKEDNHYHKTVIQYNCIVKGKVSVDGHILSDGDIFVQERHDKADYEFLEDTDLLIIRLPSISGDKHY